jgi:hypothetical protein
MSSFVLRNGYEVLVDPDDLCSTRFYTWHISGGYVVSFLNQGRRAVQNTTLRLHRFVFGLAADDPCIVDHINRNVLDNRKANLRIVDRTINGLNTEQQHHWRDFPKGIKISRSGRYEARVSQKHLGTFSSLEDALEARDAYIVENMDASWQR